jgi:hypothetical protein
MKKAGMRKRGSGKEFCHDSGIFVCFWEKRREKMIRMSAKRFRIGCVSR